MILTNLTISRQLFCEWLLLLLLCEWLSLIFLRSSLLTRLNSNTKRSASLCKCMRAQLSVLLKNVPRFYFLLYFILLFAFKVIYHHM